MSLTFIDEIDNTRYYKWRPQDKENNLILSSNGIKTNAEYRGLLTSKADEIIKSNLNIEKRFTSFNPDYFTETTDKTPYLFNDCRKIVCFKNNNCDLKTDYFARSDFINQGYIELQQ